MKNKQFNDLFGDDIALDMGQTPMSQWAEDDVPYTKLLLKGTHSLSDAELLSLIIGNASREDSSLNISRELLSRCDNNLAALWKFSVTDIRQITGISEFKAARIIALFELARRRQESEVINRQKIGNSRDAFEIFRSVLENIPYEEFWMLLLNKANRILKKVRVSEGGISGTVVDPKKIFKIALDEHASSIILAHNHPSGNLQPSDADQKITKKIREAGNFLDITVLDHLILGDDRFYSFADEGQL